MEVYDTNHELEAENKGREYSDDDPMENRYQNGKRESREVEEGYRDSQYTYTKSSQNAKHFKTMKAIILIVLILWMGIASAATEKVININGKLSQSSFHVWIVNGKKDVMNFLKGKIYTAPKDYNEFETWVKEVIGEIKKADFTESKLQTFKVECKKLLKQVQSMSKVVKESNKIDQNIENFFTQIDYFLINDMDKKQIDFCLKEQQILFSLLTDGSEDTKLYLSLDLVEQWDTSVYKELRQVKEKAEALKTCYRNIYELSKCVHNSNNTKTLNAKNCDACIERNENLIGNPYLPVRKKAIEKICVRIKHADPALNVKSNPNKRKRVPEKDDLQPTDSKVTEKIASAAIDKKPVPEVPEKFVKYWIDERKKEAAYYLKRNIYDLQVKSEIKGFEKWVEDVSYMIKFYSKPKKLQAFENKFKNLLPQVALMRQKIENSSNIDDDIERFITGMSYFLKKNDEEEIDSRLKNEIDFCLRKQQVLFSLAQFALQKKTNLSLSPDQVNEWNTDKYADIDGLKEKAKEIKELHNQIYKLTECKHEPTTLNVDISETLKKEFLKLIKQKCTDDENATKCNDCIYVDIYVDIFEPLKKEVLKLIKQKCTDDERKPNGDNEENKE